MVRLVNNDNFSLFLNLIHEIFIFFQEKVCVIDNFKRIESLQDFGNVFLDGGFPDRYPCSGWYN